MSQINAGWYPDPWGHYARRYHDGSRWTEHAQNAYNTPYLDPVSEAPLPPVPPSAPYGYGYSPYVPRPAGPEVAPAGAVGTILGTVTACVGGVILLASVFAMDFLRYSSTFEGSSGTSPGFSIGVDLSDAADAMGSGDVSLALGSYALFGRWFLIIILIPGVVIATLLAGLLSRDGTSLRLLVTAMSGGAVLLFLLWHLTAAFTAPGEFEPEMGVWIGSLGYLLLGAAPVLAVVIPGPRTASSTTRF